MSCLFCDLRDSRTATVYENDAVYVIVDRFPCSDRHLLIIPKQHHPVLHEYTDDVLTSLVLTAKFLVQKLNMEKYNLLQNNINGQIIMHCHLHLVGANESGCLKIGESSSLKLSDEAYKELTEKIKGLIDG